MAKASVPSLHLSRFTTKLFLQMSVVLAGQFADSHIPSKTNGKTLFRAVTAARGENSPIIGRREERVRLDSCVYSRIYRNQYGPLDYEEAP